LAELVERRFGLDKPGEKSAKLAERRFRFRFWDSAKLVEKSAKPHFWIARAGGEIGQTAFLDCPSWRRNRPNRIFGLRKLLEESAKLFLELSKLEEKSAKPNFWIVQAGGEIGQTAFLDRPSWRRNRPSWFFGLLKPVEESLLDCPSWRRNRPKLFFWIAQAGGGIDFGLSKLEEKSDKPRFLDCSSWWRNRFWIVQAGGEIGQGVFWIVQAGEKSAKVFLDCPSWRRNRPSWCFGFGQAGGEIDFGLPKLEEKSAKPHFWIVQAGGEIGQNSVFGLLKLVEESILDCPSWRKNRPNSVFGLSKPVEESAKPRFWIAQAGGETDFGFAQAGGENRPSCAFAACVAGGLVSVFSKVLVPFFVGRSRRQKDNLLSKITIFSLVWFPPECKTVEKNRRTRKNSQRRDLGKSGFPAYSAARAEPAHGCLASTTRGWARRRRTSTRPRSSWR